MLLTDLVLAKSGPLAKVWLSAHHERKLSKQQALRVDVGMTVDTILTQDEVTLRLSGQLMLGVVRIYGRKVQYLMDDCKETRERISMAFRPGMVDLPADQLRASKNAITFTDIGPSIDAVDILDWSFSVPNADCAPAPRGLHTAPLTQTNLRREYGAFNFGRPAAPSIYGDNSSRQGSHDESSSHLDSQDFTGIDLGLGLDDWDMSMEVGRDAQRERSRSKSAVPLRSPSVARDDLMDMDGGFDGGFDTMDLGLNDLPELDAGDLDRHRRATSALSTPPPQSPTNANVTVDVTPRTAKRITDAQQKDKPAKRVRVVRADDELELPDEHFAAPQLEDSDILGEERYIPADPEALRLREIIDDPASHFLPTIKVGDETVIFAGPAGLAPELAELFTFPVNVLRRHREEETEAGRAAKRARIGEEDEEIEVARRQSRLPSEAGFDIGMDHFESGDMGDVSFGFDQSTPPPRERQPSIAPSRAESIARAVQYADEGEHPLSVFDTRRMGDNQSLSTQFDGATQTLSEESNGGFSKATGMAMGVLRREIEAIEAEDKAVHFDKLAAGTSKRAASAFFFELLVLGTRDCVKLAQTKAFGDITVQAKDRLWEGANVPVAA